MSRHLGSVSGRKVVANGVKIQFSGERIVPGSHGLRGRSVELCEVWRGDEDEDENENENERVRLEEKFELKEISKSQVPSSQVVGTWQSMWYSEGILRVLYPYIYFFVLWLVQ